MRHGTSRVTSVAIILTLVAATAGAHQTSVPLTFWADNFKAAEARCQLEIGAGAAICGQRAWQIRRNCHLLELDGGTCDEEADDRAIEAVRLAVFRGDINPACSEADLPTLLFSDPQDIQFDVVSFCRELEAAAVSLVFNPLFAATDATTLDQAEKDCIRAFASVATKGFNYGFRTRKATLDRIAKRRRSARIKSREVTEGSRRLATANDVLLAALTSKCGEQEFEALYGFSPAQAIELVSSRSACLTGRTYAVIAFDCPDPLCGNGMREPNERCDDGNTEAGDGCGPTCQLEF